MPGMLSVIATIVRWYPRDFRARYAREVEESTRSVIQRAWQRGTVAGVAAAVRVTSDLLRSVIRERRLAKVRGGGSFGQDVRHAFRQIRRNPGFAVAVISTLALAIGGVTAVFAIADPLFFRALPYPDADRIVSLSVRTERAPNDLFAADFVQLLQDRGPFDAVAKAAVEHVGFLDDYGSGNETVAIGGVSPEFFEVFGVRPIIGRTFRREEHRGAHVALITHGLWTTVYQRRSDIVGQQLSLKRSRPITFDIIGVLPRDFLFPDFREAVPVAITPTDVNMTLVKSARYYSSPFARLPPGASRDDALATMRRVMTVVEDSSPAFRAERRVPVITPLRESMYSTVRRPMFMLLSVTVLVLVLASANLAHLFMARTAGRTRELATRQALGASRIRLLRLLIVEATVLTVAGGAAAVLLARFLKAAALSMLPSTALVVRATSEALDIRVVALAAVAAAVSLCAFGVVPAIAAVRSDLRGAPWMSVNRSSGLWRGALVLAQTSTAVAVVLTALLLVATFARLARQDLGFNPEGLQRVELMSSATATGDSARLRRLNLGTQEVLERLTGSRVALTYGIPGESLPMHVGRLDLDREAYRTIAYPVSSEFYDVFELRLVRGRFFSNEEALNGLPIMVVDERAAALSWPGADPLGKQMRDSYGAVRTVVGVVAALQTSVFRQRFQRPAAFVPLPSEPSRPFSLIWRREAVTPPLADQIRAAVSRIDPEGRAVIGPLRVIDRQLAQPRFLASLLGALGALAIALTVVGLYGVVSHGVAQRTREMGIRIALGAETRRIARLIVLQTLKPAALGVGVGLALSLWWTETLRALLFGVTPHDWRMFVATGAIVLALVVIACVLPIRRATRVDPMIALRSE